MQLLSLSLACTVGAVPQVEMLQFLANVAKGVPQKLEVLTQLVSSLFDLSPGISTYMKVSKHLGRTAALAVGPMVICSDASVT